MPTTGTLLCTLTVTFIHLEGVGCLRVSLSLRTKKQSAITGTSILKTKPGK